MSSETAQPKPEDVTNKPKAIVATVLPNAHRKKTDQEEGVQDKTDDTVKKKPRPSPAMLRRTLTKVKELDSDDEHHLIPDADQEDRGAKTVATAKTKEIAHQENGMGKIIKSSQTEEIADQQDPAGKSVKSKQTKEIADQQDPAGKSVKSKQTKVADQEEPLKKNVKSNQTEGEGKIVPSDAHGELLQRGKKKKPLPVALSEEETVDHHGHHDHRAIRGGWVIRKDDEFFHFIIICFAFGAVLVCLHNYGDWTISAGIGLLTFASLEIIGIYFGFVTRIRAVIEGFLPFFQRSALPGFSK